MSEGLKYIPACVTEAKDKTEEKLSRFLYCTKDHLA